MIVICVINEVYHMNSDSFWTNIYENRKYWICNEEMEQWPSIIACEYSRLRTACKNSCPYAIQILIKDMFEVLLKYHVLSICAWIDDVWSKNMPDCADDFHDRITCELTKRGFSLGDWEMLGVEIRKYIMDNDLQHNNIYVLFESLKEILSFFSREQIVAWRNQNIGHGALANEDDDSFRKDIVAKLELLRKLFEKINCDLKCQKLFLNSSRLTGASIEKELASCPKDSQVYLALDVDNSNIIFSLNPYLIVKSGNLFFFDNQKDEKLTNRLSYRDGKHNREKNHPWFYQLYRQLQVKTGKLYVDMDQTISAAFLTEHENAALDELRQSDFIMPSFLKQWLTRALSENTKGIFLLQMPRGTGKSTFTEELHCLNQNPKLHFDGIDARTYHLHRSQLRDDAIDDFQRECENLWSRTYEGINWARCPRIANILKSGNPDMNPAKALSGFLNSVRTYTERTRGCSKILMVIDGFDEIDCQELRSYIPTNDADLDEGVYVLLTSRPAGDKDISGEELSDETKCALKQIGENCTSQLSVAPESTENLIFLRAFLDTINVPLTDAQREALIQRADQRILYLKLLGALLESGESADTMLSDGGSIIVNYLETMLDNRSERDAEMLRELLVLLSCISQFSPLSLKELSNLLGLPGITFKLIGAMNDLTPVLKVSRGQSVGFAVVGEENRYTLVNPDLCISVWEHMRSGEWEEYLLQLVIDCMRDAAEKGSNIRGITESDRICINVLANLQNILDLCNSRQDAAMRIFDASDLNGILEYIEALEMQDSFMNTFCRAAGQTILDLSQNPEYLNASACAASDFWFNASMYIAQADARGGRFSSAKTRFDSIIKAFEQSEYDEAATAKRIEAKLGLASVLYSMEIADGAISVYREAFAEAEEIGREDLIAESCAEEHMRWLFFSHKIDKRYLVNTVSILEKKERSFAEDITLARLYYLLSHSLMSGISQIAYDRKGHKHMIRVLQNKHYLSDANTPIKRLQQYRTAFMQYEDSFLHDIGERKCKQTKIIFRNGLELVSNERGNILTSREQMLCESIEANCLYWLNGDTSRLPDGLGFGSVAESSDSKLSSLLSERKKQRDEIAKQSEERLNKGDFNGAIAMLEPVYRHTGTERESDFFRNPMAEANMLTLLAKAYIGKGKSDEALDCFAAAREIYLTNNTAEQSVVPNDSLQEQILKIRIEEIRLHIQLGRYQKEDEELLQAMVLEKPFLRYSIPLSSFFEKIDNKFYFQDQPHSIDAAALWKLYEGVLFLRKKEPERKVLHKRHIILICLGTIFFFALLVKMTNHSSTIPSSLSIHRWFMEHFPFLYELVHNPGGVALAKPMQVLKLLLCLGLIYATCKILYTTLGKWVVETVRPKLIRHSRRRRYIARKTRYQKK